MAELDLKSAWAVLDWQWQEDRVNGGTMLKLTFINLKTRLQAETYVCPSHKNWQNWHEVTANLDQGMILCNLKTKTTRGWTGINADSQPDIAWQGSNAKLADLLDKIWNPPSDFARLFE